MLLTGRFFLGISTLTVSLALYAFTLHWVNNSILKVKDFASEFVDYWCNFESFDEPVEAELANLSHCYRSLHKQLMMTGSIDKDMLQKALNKTERKKSLFFDNTGQRYYGAWQKFKELEKNAPGSANDF